MESMNKETLPTGGLYHLILYLNRRLCIEVGALGQHEFPSGTYIYTGSAKRGLPQRVSRHIKKEKNCRWHIDYLTSLVSVETLVIDASGTQSECERYHRIAELPEAEVIVRGFGSSDCKCSTHLSYFVASPSLDCLTGVKVFSVN